MQQLLEITPAGNTATQLQHVILIDSWQLDADKQQTSHVYFAEGSVTVWNTEIFLGRLKKHSEDEVQHWGEKALTPHVSVPQTMWTLTLPKQQAYVG